MGLGLTLVTVFTDSEVTVSPAPLLKKGKWVDGPFGAGFRLDCSPVPVKNYHWRIVVEE